MRQHGMKSESERRKTDKAYQGFLGIFQYESYDNITGNRRGYDIFIVLIYTYIYIAGLIWYLSKFYAMFNVEKINKKQIH